MAQQSENYESQFLKIIKKAFEKGTKGDVTTKELVEELQGDLKELITENNLPINANNSN